MVRTTAGRMVVTTTGALRANFTEFHTLGGTLRALFVESNLENVLITVVFTPYHQQLPLPFGQVFFIRLDL